jgi:hypothetical protein
MSKNRGATVKQRETRGGYPAGDKLISELKPPPPGPAPGGKRPGSDSSKSESEKKQ